MTEKIKRRTQESVSRLLFAMPYTYFYEISQKRLECVFGLKSVFYPSQAGVYIKLADSLRIIQLHQALKRVQ